MTALHPSDDDSPPSAGEWADLLAIATTPVRELASSQLPEDPGVYLWRHEGQVVYVGTAKSLRGRAWKRHLGGSRSLAASSLRRNVCELLFEIPPRVTSNPNREMVTQEQATSIREWLRQCEVSWSVCATEKEASDLESRLRTEWLPQLNRV